MARLQAFLEKITQIARPLNWLPDSALAVKLHANAVQLTHFDAAPPMRETQGGIRHLRKLIIEPLANDIGRKPLREHFVGVSAALMAAVETGGFEGADASLALPHHLFDTRVLELPWFEPEDLELDAQNPGFWEEYDPNLAQLEGRIIRYQIIYANENENRCLVLFAALAESDLIRYRSLLLDSNLFPVHLESEFFALLNAIYAELTPEELKTPHFVLHLCPSGHVLAGFSHGGFGVERIHIAEGDETLLLQLSTLDNLTPEDVAGAFWSEVGNRVAAHIKTAMTTLTNAHAFAPPESVVFLCDYPHFDNYHQLLKEPLGDVRLVPFNGLKGFSLTPRETGLLDSFVNSGIFTSARGLTTRGFHHAARMRELAPRIDLNFLDDFDMIRQNRQLAVIQKLLLLACLGVGLLTAGWLGFGTMPDWLATRAVNAEHDQNRARVGVESKRKKTNQQELDALTSSNAVLIKAVTPKPYTNLFEKLPVLVPPNIELKSLTIDENGVLKIHGLTRDNQSINQLKAGFTKNHFTHVPPQTQFSRGNKSAHDFIDFTLNATLIRNQ